MRAVVLYESMFGNTRQIATAIAEGLGVQWRVTVLDVNDAVPQDDRSADLLVIGGPTHAFGMSRPSTRAEAVTWARDPRRHLDLEPRAPGQGIRERLADSTGVMAPHFAAFTTRADRSPLFTGNAAVKIDAAVRRRGSRRLARPESFRVTKHNRLCVGELDRARDWGRLLGVAGAQAGAGTRPVATPGV